MQVLAEMFRVLVAEAAGSAIVRTWIADDRLSAADRAAAGSYVGCIAGALSRSGACRAGGGPDPGRGDLHARAAPGMHSAIVRAVKPSA